jgi:polyvinyl alcohol dehydrogenase (cytochrome)
MAGRVSVVASFVLLGGCIVSLGAQAPPVTAVPPSQAPAVETTDTLGAPTPGARLSESMGAAQYYTNCVSCHESTTEGHQAPRTAVLKQMTPEHVYDVLTTGSMRGNAASLSDADKRLIAEWLGGRRIDTARVGGRMPNMCTSNAAVALTGPMWNGWGIDYRNTRFQSAKGAGLTPAQVSRLELKWAFGFPGATALYSQAYVGGRLYVSSNAGYVYSLDADSGCVHWAYQPQAAVRSSFTVGKPSPTSSRVLVYFGDIHGAAYALDATTGELVWKMQTDPHPLARITGTPVLFEQRLYVPVTSLEEPEAGQADYACCDFRGFVTALDAATGKAIWKTYTIPETPAVVGKNSRGKDMIAPAGAGVWVTPALDVKRRALYFGTGNAFSGQPKTANAVMALNIDTGRVLWSMQALPFDTWHNGCIQNIPGRRGGGPGGPGGNAPGRGGAPFGRGGAPRYPPENCPEVLGPDWDFSASSIIATAGGRDLVISAEKQGLIWALDPANGAVVWKADVAREIAGGRGETLFGAALDDEHVYFGLISSGHLALDVKTGEEAWWVPLPSPTGREAKRGVVGAVTLIPGVLLSAARDGMVRATSSKTGQILWQYDAARSFTTVNGVPGLGGSGASGGPIVANGMVFVGMGYPGFQGGDGGNVLLAFAPALRLDAHADALKRQSEAGR